MYEAKVNGESLDISGISISFCLKNPMFDDLNSMSGDYTYPFEIPLTPNNKRILKFINRVNAEQMAVEFEFEHYFSGIRLPGNILQVTQTTNGMLKANVKIGRGGLISTIKDLNIQDVNMELPEVYSSTYLGHPESVLNVCDKKFPLVKFAIAPVYNEAILDGTPNETWWHDVITWNTWNMYVNNYVWRSDISRYDTGLVTTPFPYVAAVLEYLIAELGFVCFRNRFASDEGLRELVIYNPNYMATASGYKINLANHVPSMSVAEFLMQLRNLFGIDMYLHNFRNELRLIGRDEILNSSEIVEFSEGCQRDSDLYFEAFDGFSLKHGMDSDDEVWTTQVKDISPMIPYELSPVAYVGGLPTSGISSGDICFVTTENCYYQSSYDLNTGLFSWTFLAYDYQPYSEGGLSKINIESKAGPVYDGVGNRTPGSHQWVVPMVKQKGNPVASDYPVNKGVKQNPFSLRLMFYRGMGVDWDFEPMPICTSFLGPVSPAKYILRWGGPNSHTLFKDRCIYESFWKGWINWKMNIAKKVWFYKRMSAFDIFNLDFTKKYRVNGVNYLIESAEFTITEREIQMAKFIAWRV